MNGRSRERTLVDVRGRRRCGLVALYLLALMPILVPAAHRAISENANSPLDWVGDDFPARQQYRRFCDDFGMADSVVISWPGCQIDDSRLDRYVEALRRAPAFQDSGGELFHRVQSGREMLAMMMRSPTGMSRSIAIERLQGFLIGPDGQTTCVIIGFTERALERRRHLVPLIRRAAVKYCDAPWDQHHLAGPVMDGYMVDRESQLTTNRLAPLSSLVVLIVCYACLNSVRAALLVFGISFLCQLASLAIIDLSGGKMTALLIVLPPLVQVLTIACGIHFTNYWMDGFRDGDRAAAARRALELSWLPCLLSAITTAIGLGSLGVSGLTAVREFGYYAAIAVLLSTLLMLSLLYTVVQVIPLMGFQRQSFRSTAWVRRTWMRMAIWQQRSWAVILVGAGLLMIGLGVGMSRLQAGVRIETLFRSDSRLIQDYAWLESHVGPLVPIEVTATISQTNRGSVDEMELLKRIERQIERVPSVHKTVSALTFLAPQLNQYDADTSAAMLRVHGDRNLSEFLLRMSQPIGYAIDRDDQTHIWRVTALVSALKGNDYRTIQSDLQKALEEVMKPSFALSGASLQGESPDNNVSFSVTGLMPLVHEIQQQLLRDLFSSFVTAFALIAVVMTIVQAGMVMGLAAMIPNIFPTLVLFGLLGWMGRRLDIGSIMTASVAMGIAVDDTLHYLTYYQRQRDRGRRKLYAIALAYQHCGRAMFQTTLICGLGMAIFAFSPLVPTAGFAWMMAVLLAAALIGDLVVLPAILLSPLGDTDQWHGVQKKRCDSPARSVAGEAA